MSSPGEIPQHVRDDLDRFRLAGNAVIDSFVARYREALERSNGDQAVALAGGAKILRSLHPESVFSLLLIACERMALDVSIPGLADLPPLVTTDEVDGDGEAE